MKSVLAFLTLGLLASCTSSPSSRIADQEDFAMISSRTETTDQSLIEKFKASDNILIQFGSGGEVDGMLATLKYLNAHPDKLIVIDGPCFSACTLLLAAPTNVVYTENAEFYFHSARNVWKKDGVITKQELSWAGNEKMLDVLPDPIVEWTYQTSAFYSADFTRMDNTTVRELLPKMFMQSKNIPSSAYKL